MAKTALSKRAVNKIISIAEGTTKEYRNVLDKNFHVADISFNALKGSVNSLNDVEYNTIIDAFQSSARHTSASLRNAIKQAKNEEWLGLIYVSDPKFGNFLIAQSYNTLQTYTSNILKALTTTYSNLNVLVGTDISGKTYSRIGHIASSYLHATTPLLEKFRDIYKRLPLAASNKLISEISNLQNAHTFDVEYLFDRTDVDTKEFESILGRGTVLVTIQSDAKNSDLAKIEAKINARVIAYLKSDEFAKDLLVEPGSNTILEDIAYKLSSILDPKLPKPVKHKKKPVTKKSGKVNSTSKPLPFQLQPIKESVVSSEPSLTSLQSLINRHLQDVIAANMGDGNSKNTLNYRTGRLAASAKVERMTQSREGMITAFYSYMKNPYATFSEGGQQQFPRSRDPKLLISKSIREIAAEKVANRMRAVAV